MRIYIIFFLLIGSRVMAEVTAPPTCVGIIVPGISKQIVDTNTQEIFLIGMAAKTKKGDFFAFGHYLATGHKQDLVNLIEKAGGPITHYYWAGEVSGRVAVENGPFTLSASNQTSRFFLNLPETMKSSNPLEDFIRLAQLLTGNASNIRMFKFDQSQQHLLAALNGVAKNIRHDLANELQLMMSALEAIAKKSAPPYKLELSQEALKFSLEAIRFFVDMGYIPPRNSKDLELAERFLKTSSWEEVISSWQKEESQQLLTFLVTFARERMQFLAGKRSLAVVVPIPNDIRN